MSDVDEDPRCPECGEPIGMTATYCMHCSADLTEERAAADADGDGAWDAPDPESTMDSPSASPSPATDDSDRLLDPDGLVDNSLTVLVGVVGGIVVGVVGTIVLAALTASGWALPFGFVAWLGATAYLVRRRTVQAAVAKSGYAVALVLLSVPVIALSPALSVDGGIEERGGLFLVLVLFVGLPATVAAGIGWFASRFVPADGTDSDG